MNGSFLNRLFSGLVIISVGVFFLLKQLGMIDYDISIGEIISNYWPVVLLWIGLHGLLAGRQGHGSGWWAGMMILLGFIFLGHNLEWFAWSFGDIVSYAWPIIIILVGINFLRRPRHRHHEPPQYDDEWKSYNSYSDYKGDIPSAPPLHPDPTKAGEETADPAHSHNPSPGETGAFKERTAGGEPEADLRREPYHHLRRHQNFKHELRHHIHEQKRHIRQHKQQVKEHIREHHQRSKHGSFEYWNHDPSAQSRSGFIGDIHIGQDYWELKPLNISHFIGDTIVDLTKAQIPFGETKICISSFIGDVKVYVPNDFEVGVQVISSAFVGDVKILGQKEGGMFKSINIHSPYYEETDKKIKLVVSTFIGDVRVTKVG
ncbi:cell wall-active antibiotics response protein LiaF [Paenibacillus glycanilyticus]|uniref:cell wall-active antibiotics response protein LiaF n=1 Tax=Paenibacillus glycanilyticus TaxID=126569 RepID=UPI00203C197D|nr:cell wall-active antibiotics response protein LiaF [Paenibacillus glycanilyticus]MCM3629218.1 cell wall-active antibiotics response protein LiaF [Paenibacillus glycanilyticus]